MGHAGLPDLGLSGGGLPPASWILCGEPSPIPPKQQGDRKFRHESNEEGPFPGRGGKAHFGNGDLFKILMHAGDQESPFGPEGSPREAGQSMVNVLLESRRAVTGRPFTLTGSIGALSRDVMWRAHPASQGFLRS